MKRLKALRQNYNYTQHQLAEMLKTTQQTVARWESGKAEPSIAALRDLAMIFGTSVDDILGKNPWSEKISSVHLDYFKKEAISDGFWGHVGLLIPGQKKTKWFPITTNTAENISESLNDREDMGWICIATLKNKILAANITKVRRIWLLDEACDAPDDWDVDATEDYAGHPLELYRGVDAFFSEVSTVEENSSVYDKIVKDFVKEKKLDHENVYKFLHYTTIYMADGAVTSYWAEPDNLHDIIFNIDLDFLPRILPIHEFDGEFESYYPVDNLAVIEMPLIDAMDAAKAVQEDAAAAEATDDEEEGKNVRPAAEARSEITTGSRAGKKRTRKPKPAE